MTDIDKIKIEIFDLQRRQEKLHFEAKEVERQKLQKIEILNKLENASSTPKVA